AYTCYSIPASVARAGLKLQPVDIDPETLDYDFRALEAISSAGLLCVLTSNLFGLPSDAESVARIAHSRGAFAVDDAAQAMGAVRNGRQAGTAGDAGLFSLGRGKALAAGGGGLVVTSDRRIADALRAQFTKLPRASMASAPAAFLENLTITLLLHPRLYWIPNSFPLLKLGVTEFDPAFPLKSMSGFTHALLVRVIEGLADLNRVRNRNARQILSSLAQGSGFHSPAPAAGALPIYLRLPLLAANRTLRDHALARLRSAGIGASPYYPGAVCDIPGIEPFLATPGVHFPRAEGVASRILTLPTHPLVEPGDLERMLEILVASSRESSSHPVGAEARGSTAWGGRE
ncbi:MAG: DegT/DnrJ/EryC1/StrS family aminotransferase, partial [Terriglobales bacterium]